MPPAHVQPQPHDGRRATFPGGILGWQMHQFVIIASTVPQDIQEYGSLLGREGVGIIYNALYLASFSPLQYRVSYILKIDSRMENWALERSFCSSRSTVHWR